MNETNQTNQNSITIGTGSNGMIKVYFGDWDADKVKNLVQEVQHVYDLTFGLRQVRKAR